MTINNWGADDPIEATKGGTALSTYSTGDIIYASAANTWAKLAAGSDGDLLTLASGVPSWSASAGGGGMIPLNTQSASSSSSIDFNSTYITATYDVYVVLIYNLLPASDSDMYIRFSPDNGSTIRTTGYVASQFRQASTSVTTATDAIHLNAQNIGQAATEGMFSAYVILSNLSDSGVKSRAVGDSNYMDTGATNESDWGVGRYDTAETHNFVSFLMSTGNITTGVFTLYGVENP